ncbi:hypothetical protein D3C83_261150 [compost metagenome]
MGGLFAGRGGCAGKEGVVHGIISREDSFRGEAEGMEETPVRCAADERRVKG